MKLQHKLLALVLAASATGALAAEGAPAGNEIIGNIRSDRAATERAQCMQAAGIWRSVSLRRIDASIPSYECMSHFYSNTGDGFASRGRSLPSRDDYNTWQLLLQTYAQSDAVAAVRDYPSPKRSLATDWLGAGPAARNVKKVEDGWRNMLMASPFETAPVVGAVADHMQRNTVKCGPEYLDSIQAVKNAALRAAALRQYDKACGAEAMAKEAKAKAEMAAKMAERAPALLELSDLEPVPSRQQLPAAQLAALRDLPGLKTVTIGVPTAPTVWMLLDIGAPTSWAAVAQMWPAVREGKVALKVVPMAATGAAAQDVAVLLASKNPTQLVRTWIRHSDKGQKTITGAEKERIRDANWTEQLDADRERRTPAPEIKFAPLADADALAAAQAAVTRNTEMVLKAGLTSLPVAIVQWAANADVVTGVPTDGLRAVMGNALAALNKPAELAYETGIASQLREIGMLPKGSAVAGKLEAQVCAAEGVCWAAEGEKKKGWF